MKTKSVLVFAAALAGALPGAGCSRRQAADSGSEAALPTNHAVAASGNVVAPVTPPATNPPAAVVGTAVAAGAVPAATSDPALRKRLVTIFSGYEHIANRGELAGLASQTELTRALRDVYADPAVHLSVRVQALASLRFFPSDEAKEIFEKVLLASDTTDIARHAAVKAYGAGFGEAAVPVLGRMLEFPELHTRNAAARTLSDIGGDKALFALRQRLPQEREALVKSSIEAALAKQEKADLAAKPERRPNPTP